MARPARLDWENGASEVFLKTDIPTPAYYVRFALPGERPKIQVIKDAKHLPKRASPVPAEVIRLGQKQVAAARAAALEAHPPLVPGKLQNATSSPKNASMLIANRYPENHCLPMPARVMQAPKKVYVESRYDPHLDPDKLLAMKGHGRATLLTEQGPKPKFTGDMADPLFGHLVDFYFQMTRYATGKYPTTFARLHESMAFIYEDWPYNTALQNRWIDQLLEEVRTGTMQRRHRVTGEAYLPELIGGRAASAFIRSVNSFLSAVCNLAKREQIIESLPVFDRVQGAAYQRVKAPVVPWSTEDLDAVVERARQWAPRGWDHLQMYTYCRLLRETAARSIWVRALRWKHVIDRPNPSTGTPDLVLLYTHCRATKASSKKKIADWVCGADLANFLRGERQRRKAKDSDYVCFAGPKSHGNDGNLFNRQLDKMLDDMNKERATAGLPALSGLSHNFRHSFMTEARENDLLDAAAEAANLDIRTARRIYAHDTHIRQAELSNRLSAARARGSSPT